MEITTRLEHVEEYLADLAAAQSRTESAIATLAERMSELAGGQRELVAAQRRTEEQMALLATAQTRTEEELREINRWRRGESGRRLGERYELNVVAKAPVILDGGEGGGMGSETVRRHLTPLLTGSFDDVAARVDTSNPFLADLVWWKGPHYAVVEVSHTVDEHDVERAHARANSLRRAGLSALAVVIGSAWKDDEPLAQAETLGLAWYIGDEMNDRFIEYRKLPG